MAPTRLEVNAPFLLADGEEDAEAVAVGDDLRLHVGFGRAAAANRLTDH